MDNVDFYRFGRSVNLGKLENNRIWLKKRCKNTTFLVTKCSPVFGFAIVHGSACERRLRCMRLLKSITCKTFCFPC